MIDKQARQNLLRIAAAYAKASEQSLSTVSRDFYGKSRFFDDFRRGKQSISIASLDRLLAKFARSWPDGAEWPDLPPLSMARPPGKTPRKAVEDRPVV